MSDRSVFKNQVDLEGTTNAKGALVAKKLLAHLPTAGAMGVYEAAI